MHELWCGKPCCDCETSCEIDEEIPCSPDCEALNEDGSRDIARCIDSGCDAYELSIKEADLYQEIELFVEDTKVGEAEVNLKTKMLSRFDIYPPYQGNGYGTQAVGILNAKYGCDCLWVRKDNEKAIHVYEKNGYKINEPTMYMMTRDNKSTIL